MVRLAGILARLLPSSGDLDSTFKGSCAPKVALRLDGPIRRDVLPPLLDSLGMRRTAPAAEPTAVRVDAAGRERDRDDRNRLAETPGDGELIRWSLSLSPEERLGVLQDFVDAFWTPRHG